MMVKYVIQFKAESIKPMFIVASYYEVDENRVLNVYNDCDTALFSANMSDIMYIMETNPDTVAWKAKRGRSNYLSLF